MEIRLCTNAVQDVKNTEVKILRHQGEGELSAQGMGSMTLENSIPKP